MATPANSILDALGVEAFDSATPPTFQELLQRLYDLRYQGSITMDFAGGLPRSIVLTQPVRIPLDTPSRKHPLDKPT